MNDACANSRPLLFAALSALSIVAGGGNSDASPAPSPSLVISPATNFLFIGQSQTLSAFVNGELRPSSSVVWSSSDPAVVIAAPGVIAGARNGNAVVTVTALGLSQSIAIRVAPDYRGGWSGTYVPTGCARDA